MGDTHKQSDLMLQTEKRQNVKELDFVIRRTRRTLDPPLCMALFLDFISNTAANGGLVLTYNITNERGWNDPPSSVFSPSSGGRKRIDPRKRVAHNFNNAGYNSPAPPSNGSISPLPPGIPPNPPNICHYPPQSQNLNQTLQNMHLNPSVGGGIYHSTSNPDLHQMAQNQPQGIHHAASVPSGINTQSQRDGGIKPPSVVSNGFVNGYQATQYYKNSGSTTTGGSRTPPLKQLHENHERKLSVPALLAEDAQNSIFQTMVTPTMLNSSHLQTNSNLQNNQGYANLPVPPSNSFSVNGNVSSNSEPKMSSLPPMSTLSGQNIYGRSNSGPPAAMQRISPTNVLTGPPPTTGFYRKSSAEHSPKSMSPGNSGKNSPVPVMNEKIENDSELLNTTVSSLNRCKEICACLLPNKISDDISKRIQAFENSWKVNKLSNSVKLRMSQLAAALTQSEFGAADNLHRVLVCDHANEVMPWILGIKKLIATYQQAVLDNNKY